MAVSILHLGHNTFDGADKIWGGAIAVNPDGRKTGFRFWGPRTGKLRFKVCNGDFQGEIALAAMWRKKEAGGYEEVQSRSLDLIQLNLGVECRDHISEIIASVMLLGVDETARVTA